ncbi:LacI family transcriptional regulator [bacterium]|nr:MAG: LacI family transcriptional regulator [bacterium]
MRVTQQDIARIASVSQATVSRVLAGDDKVEPLVRERVTLAIKENNYRPDVRARSLRSQRTGLVGLVINRPQGGLSDDPFFSSLVSDILDFLNGTPYHLCLDMVNSELGQTSVYDEMLRTRRVDGLILVESEARDHRIARLQEDRFPFVLIGNPLSVDIASVDNDNVLAAEVATSHLLEEGFKRVGILAGRAGVTVSDDRVAGYQRAIRGRQEAHLIWHAEFGFESAQAAASEILQSEARPDAFVVMDDFMAMGVVAATRKMGLRIPQDLAIVSFNDTHLCNLLEGGLTSVDLRMEEIVHRSCDTLLRIIEERPVSEPRRQIVACELRVRGSSRREVSA